MTGKQAHTADEAFADLLQAFDLLYREVVGKAPDDELRRHYGVSAAHHILQAKEWRDRAALLKARPTPSETE